jgi:hypothetical protein
MLKEFEPERIPDQLLDYTPRGIRFIGRPKLTLEGSACYRGTELIEMFKS